MNRRAAVLYCVLLCVSVAAYAQISLNEKEYFEAPGFSFLTFHNNYMVGYQGGLQMIQNGERVLDSGDLYLQPKQGPAPQHLILKRDVDRVNGTATITAKLDGRNISYRLITRTNGGDIFVRLELDRPVNDWATHAALRFHLYPGVYLSRSYQGETGFGLFLRQYTGTPVLLANSRTIRLAQEHELYAVTFTRNDGTLSLIDRRDNSPQRWFAVDAPLKPRATAVEVKISPTLRPRWHRASVIGISQAGYHPQQKKTAIIELDERSEAGSPVRLVRLNVSGDMALVKEAVPAAWGRFHRFRYATFDFSEVREPGMYVVQFENERAGPFPIGNDALDEAWRPALQYFLPIQMCHVLVREGSRVWHGACHLDDALQAPAGKRHLDGYEQTAQRETRFADNEHVPGLDWGGWHDAGDHDLPAGSIARTAMTLALAYDEFRPAIDETSIKRPQREVELHVRDGRNDLLQQVEYGVEWLLATLAAGGHILPGVVETTGRAYGHLGDMSSVTDNLVYDRTLKALDRSVTLSGKFDDRWVFTNRNTGLQYLTAQTLAIASRVLNEENGRLAEQCLKAAVGLWLYEQKHPSVYARSAYTPRDSGFRSEEIAATAELFLTTGEARYRDHLISLLPVIEKIDGDQFGHGPGWTLARVADRANHPEIKATVRRLATAWKAIAERRAAQSPYGVHYPQEVQEPGYKLESRSGIHSGFVWGHGWNLQTDAFHHYFLHKHMPDLFSAEPIHAVVNYVLGCHPATNESLVSGVGAHSTLAAYGFNRADWSHIPGGVISGTSLVKPDYLELKTFPFLWYQTEYVIHGAATYIFDVLAAQHLASSSTPTGDGAAKRTGS